MARSSLEAEDVCLLRKIRVLGLPLSSTEVLGVGAMVSIIEVEERMRLLDMVLSILSFITKSRKLE